MASRESGELLHLHPVGFRHRRGARRRGPGREVLFQNPAARARCRQICERSMPGVRGELPRHRRGADLPSRVCRVAVRSQRSIARRRPRCPRCWRRGRSRSVSSLPTTVPASAWGARGRRLAVGAPRQPQTGAGAALVRMRATTSPTLTTCPLTRDISTTTPSTGEGISVTTLSVSTTARASPAFTLWPGGHFQLDDGPFREALPDVGETELVQPCVTAHRSSPFALPPSSAPR